MKYFAIKILALQPSADQKYIVKNKAVAKFEKKELEPEIEPKHAHYGDALIPGEPFMYQILQFIASKGDDGCTSNEVTAHFGIDQLLFRLAVKTLMSDGRIESTNTVSKKTNQFVYRLKKRSADDSARMESNEHFSHATHLSTNMERLQAIFEVFQKQKVLSRPEIRKFLRNEKFDSSFAQIDGKTLNRLLNTLCKEKKIIHLGLKGSVPSDKELDMYYVADCSTEELQKRISIIKSRLEKPQSHEAIEGLSHVYLHAYSSLNFPNPIPETFEGFGDYTSPGAFYGPKMVFVQQFHLMLSILIYRWPVSPIIPAHHLNLKDWWEYILKLDPILPNENGEYEVISFLNHFPIYFLKYFNKNWLYESFMEVMDDEVYSKRCIGQLPRDLLVNLSGSICHFCNSIAKFIELLEVMDLVEIKQKFDFSKKSLTGFKFQLRKSALLLNTAYAPINKEFFKGYNIRRIHDPKRVLVFKVSEFHGFVNFWSKAQEICLSGTFHEAVAFCRNIKEPARSFLQVLKEHNIPLDEPEQFYNSAGTAERLDTVYSELGPAGFMIKLMTNKRDHWCASIKTSRKPFRADIAVASVTRILDNSSASSLPSEKKDSDSDDYVVFKPKEKRKKGLLSKKVSSKTVSKKKVKKEPSSQPPKKLPKEQPSSLSVPKGVPTGTRKRTLSVGDHSVAKRIRKKYRDELDVKINSMKTHERVKYTEKEDNIIIIWSVCMKIFGVTNSPQQTRNLLHNCCPKEAADKTEESSKKRRALLLERPEVLSRMVDLQAKGTAFRDIIRPKIDKAIDLFYRHGEWATDLFIVRSILPASFGDFIDKHEIKEFGAEPVNHLTVFLTEGYRNRRVLNFKECNVASVWNNPQFTDHHKHIFRILMLAVGTESPIHNDAAFKVIKSFEDEKLTGVTDYMYKHQILRRQKRKVSTDGKVTEAQRVAINMETTQCLYSPFPDEIISNPLDDSSENPLEVHYSELTPKILHNISEAYFDGHCKIIISGAINPFIENKKLESVFSNADSEDTAFTEIHTKRNTFFSGLSTIEEGRSLGFQLSEKHISGRLNYKVHSPNDDDKVEGYEELLGIKESSWPLPMKIFVSSSPPGGVFNWRSVDFENGTISDYSVTNNEGSFCPTELNSFELNKACLNNMSSFVNDDEKILSFVSVCCEKGLTDLTTPGKELLQKIFKSKQAGIAEKDVINDIMFKHKLSFEQISSLINLSISLEMVMRVGFIEPILVGKQHSASWLICMPCGSLNDSQAAEKEGEESKVSDQKLESDFMKYFPLAAKPWRSINSDINVTLLRDLTKSVVLFIYAYPGTSKKLIDKRYHAYMSPVDSQELLESLLFSEIIKRCWDKPPAPGLFTATAPTVTISRQITSASCFSVTDNGLKNFAAFLK